MKKIIIIGAGISGLTAGIFARLHGFYTEIYEMHNIPGGECTGWSRKGYHFDNCIHWLTGTNKETDLYKIWLEIGALDNTMIYEDEFLFSINDDNKKFYLYKNLYKLKEHMLELAPEDKDEIDKFIELVKKVQKFNIPTKKSIDMMNIFDYFKFAKAFMGVGKDLANLSKLYIEDYTKNFKSDLIKAGLESICPKGSTALAVFITIATLTTGNGGYPMGGSLAMSRRVENKYKDLGGKVIYNAKVKKIIVEDGTIKGIELENGRVITGDYVIAAIDANELIKNLLGDKYNEPVFKEQFNNTKDYKLNSSVDIGLGVNCDLSMRDRSAIFKVKPFKCGSNMIDTLCMSHYCHEKDFAPKGCSSIRVHIINDDYDYWKNLKENNRETYYNEKEQVAIEVIKRIEEIYTETKGKFEMYDVSTPVTYERYCNAYRGAWMAFNTEPRAKQITPKGTIKGISRLYIAGQWVFSPGGLPGACLTGKWAVQKICKQENIKFKFDF